MEGMAEVSFLGDRQAPFYLVNPPGAGGCSRKALHRTDRTEGILSLVCNHCEPCTLSVTLPFPMRLRHDAGRLVLCSKHSLPLNHAVVAVLGKLDYLHRNTYMFHYTLNFLILVLYFITSEYF